MLSLMLLLVTISAFAAGPIYRHHEAEKQLEFENVYQDIRSVTRSTTTLASGSTNYIQNTNTLQSGATVYLTTGTVTNFTAGTVTVNGMMHLLGPSGQLAFGGLVSANRILISAPQPAANTVYRIPDVGTAGDFFLTTGTQTVTGMPTISSATVTTLNGTTMIVSSGTIRSFTATASSVTWLRSGAGSTSLTALGPNGDDNTGFIFPSADTIQEITAGSIARAVSSVGEITQPLQPSFFVTAPVNTANVTGDGTTATIEYDTEIYDQGSDFNSTTYTFTAPVTGRYDLRASLLGTGHLTTHTLGVLLLVTSNRTIIGTRDSGLSAVTDGFAEYQVSVIADMDANDTAVVQFIVSGATKVVEPIDDARYNHFSGSLTN